MLITKITILDKKNLKAIKIISYTRSGRPTN